MSGGRAGSRPRPVRTGRGRGRRRARGQRRAGAGRGAGAGGSDAFVASTVSPDPDAIAPESRKFIKKVSSPSAARSTCRPARRGGSEQHRGPPAGRRGGGSEQHLAREREVSPRVSTRLVEENDARGVLGPGAALALRASLLRLPDEVGQLAALLVPDVVRVAARQPVELARVRKLAQVPPPKVAVGEAPVPAAGGAREARR